MIVSYINKEFLKRETYSRALYREISLKSNGEE